MIDHFNFCRHYYSKEILYGIAGEVLGTLDWRVTEVGRGQSGAREAFISAELAEFKTSGYFNDSSRLTIYLGTNAKQGQNACQAVGATNPITNTVAQWKANGLLGWSIISDHTLGAGDEEVVNCMWSIYNRAAPYLEMWTNWASPPYQDLRFDSAYYLPQKTGVIFSRVIPVMQYSQTDPLVKDVAEHLYTAFTNPNSTLPAQANGSKVIPGNIKATPPSLITRLYRGANLIADQAYRDNRAAVEKACAPLPHKPDEECDEFPFASTWEGAGRGDGNFSVRYVDGTQNGKAGTQLSTWYGSDRILHNDKFGVEILP
ncbi:NucA/NucB deoxyribonuclease domain-containing protein [Kitasatospora brasiliensis]|uniref:NucA/NucB deoxyribonuclease domain-containing protein n=1 Tax=Kitasatospora brasiliensis TaxID=3058040 RepID=UPI002931CD78|nr:NucA/NucB deoxyribonuclease domain-containing protein [Kitasatospora sp. K002]